MPMHVGSMAIFRLPGDYEGDFFEDFKAMTPRGCTSPPILSAPGKGAVDIDHPFLGRGRPVRTTVISFPVTASHDTRN